MLDFGEGDVEGGHGVICKYCLVRDLPGGWDRVTEGEVGEWEEGTHTPPGVIEKVVQPIAAH